MAVKEDLYIILDVRRSASLTDIKRAFRKLARRFHPDINPGDHYAEDQFKRITEAYGILSDPLKRQFYDVNGFYTEGVLEQSGTGSGWNFSFKGFDFSRSSDSRFEEIFGQVFNRPAMKGEPEQGEDLEHQIATSFEESMRGMTASITIARQKSCSDCSGTGRDLDTVDFVCDGCGGTGKIIRIKGHLQFSVACGDCYGTGKSVQRCRSCAGEGRMPGSETLNVELPPGITTGSRIRVPGKGNAGRLGGPNGDLYVVTNITPHPFFQRIGDNIHCALPLTVTEAALGTKVEVPTIDGPAMVRIPPGTQTGHRLSLRNK
jgi:molecular chaperone DnaJ